MRGAVLECILTYAHRRLRWLTRNNTWQLASVSVSTRTILRKQLRCRLSISICSTERVFHCVIIEIAINWNGFNGGISLENVSYLIFVGLQLLWIKVWNVVPSSESSSKLRTNLPLTFNGNFIISCCYDLLSSAWSPLKFLILSSILILWLQCFLSFCSDLKCSWLTLQFPSLFIKRVTPTHMKLKQWNLSGSFPISSLPQILFYTPWE